ncbi:MAG: 30S ribosomal protein S20 [Humidesulfovibrio sp.]|nr:30S ribosomal protein S20 [Humidesulfovibrio sp.]PKN09240.1 MAG: 30S ribosomal protein S20 [Deltaproteobacteria bacterium HGW-Deltaproteobacteria-8]
MANHPSASKRHRQSLKRQARNKSVKTRIKNVVKAVRQALAEKNADTAAIALKTASSVLDRAASKKVIHWKKAGRCIARLQTAVNKMAAVEA